MFPVGKLQGIVLKSGRRLVVPATSLLGGHEGVVGRHPGFFLGVYVFLQLLFSYLSS